MSPLALRAKESAASGLNYPFDDAPTIVPLAGFIFLIVDGERVLKIAQLAIRVCMIPQRRAACFNGVGNDVSNIRRQLFQPDAGFSSFGHNRAGCSLGR